MKKLKYIYIFIFINYSFTVRMTALILTVILLWVSNLISSLREKSLIENMVLKRIFGLTASVVFPELLQYPCLRMILNVNLNIAVQMKTVKKKYIRGRYINSIYRVIF